MPRGYLLWGSATFVWIKFPTTDVLEKLLDELERLIAEDELEVATETLLTARERLIADDELTDATDELRLLDTVLALVTDEELDADDRVDCNFPSPPLLPAPPHATKNAAPIKHTNLKINDVIS